MPDGLARRSCRPCPRRSAAPRRCRTASAAVARAGPRRAPGRRRRRGCGTPRGSRPSWSCRPRWAQQREDLAVGDVQVDAVDGGQPPGTSCGGRVLLPRLSPFEPAPLLRRRATTGGRTAVRRSMDSRRSPGFGRGVAGRVRRHSLSAMDAPALFAISDLHVAYAENREIVERLRPAPPRRLADRRRRRRRRCSPTSSGRWRCSAGRFAKVIWAPGNHELWTPPEDPVQLRGVARYEHLVAALPGARRRHPRGRLPGVDGAGRPGRGRAAVPAVRLLVPRRRASTTKEESLAAGVRGRGGLHRRDPAAPRPVPEPGGVVPGPGGGDRAAARRRRPGAADRAGQPLPAGPRADPVLRYPEFAQWCGTDRTADWHPASGPRRRLRPPAHPAHHLVRRRALRGGVGRLSARVAPAGRHCPERCAGCCADPAVRRRC